MARPQISIGRLMAVIVILSLLFGTVRAFLVLGSLQGMLLPALGFEGRLLAALFTHNAARRFWLGFSLACPAVVGVCAFAELLNLSSIGTALLAFPVLVMSHLPLSIGQLLMNEGPGSLGHVPLIELFVDLTIGIQLILPALLVGVLASRIRPRRSRSTSQPSAQVATT
jgi:hypothetical protein